jgi:ABC-type phosphate/phosphonate transport system substrate-binding protein
MNLPRRAIAAIAGGKPFFGKRILTGSQAASVDSVARGEADVATVDCVTDAVLRRHRPEFMQQLRVLTETARSPSLPFVTSIETSERDAAILRQCLVDLAHEPAICAGLLIRDFVALAERDYEPVVEHRDEAVRLGYPELV